MQNFFTNVNSLLLIKFAFSNRSSHENKHILYKVSLLMKPSRSKNTFCYVIHSIHSFLFVHNFNLTANKSSLQSPTLDEYFIFKLLQALANSSYKNKCILVPSTGNKRTQILEYIK